jgi:hypothetical protein
MATTKAKQVKTMGSWIDSLDNHLGQYLQLETSDGIRREGRLSGLSTKTIRLNGVEEKMLTDLELNGDPQDRVAIDRIATIDFL